MKKAAKAKPSHAPTEVLHVYLDATECRKVGRLALHERQILFEYDSAFLASGIQLSPFYLPLQPGVIGSRGGQIGGLFGVFNDSLPDGWGRLLLDRALAKLGVNTNALSPLDRLAHVGRNGMGALTYEPDHNPTDPTIADINLDAVARDAAKVLKGDTQSVVTELLALNNASGGARPKVVVQASADLQRIVHWAGPLPKGYRHWIIKFPAVVDDNAIGTIEYGYALMAQAAGVEMPPTHLFTTGKSGRYFGVERFDRDRDRRIHMHSVSGLLGADIKVPTLDYNDLMKVTHRLTRNVGDLERMFRLACFNVFAHNRDDHAKNFSFIMDATGQWALAPAYDLTFSPGPGGEQSTTVLGEGRSPGVSQLEQLAKLHGIKSATAIIDQTQAAISKWKDFAKAAGVPKRASDDIAAVIVPATIPNVVRGKGTSPSTKKRPTNKQQTMTAPPMTPTTTSPSTTNTPAKKRATGPKKPAAKEMPTKPTKTAAKAKR